MVSDHVQGSGHVEAGPDGVQDRALELGVGFAEALGETPAAGADPQAENMATTPTRARCSSARLTEVTPEIRVAEGSFVMPDQTVAPARSYGPAAKTARFWGSSLKL